MKQKRFLHASAIAVGMAFLLASCSSGGEKQETETATTDSMVTDTTTSMQNSEPATAQPGKVLIVKEKVANYAKWKESYDARDSMRQANGLSNYVLGRGMDDSNTVVIILKMADVNKAKELANSQQLKDKLHKGGVIGTPTFEYLDVVMNDDAPIAVNSRLMVSHKVKDWDAWKKSFDEHKQARMDAGLTDRGLGYHDGDNHLVSIVFAVNDKKKADEFLKSKDLKDKMAEAGVDGPPSFFYYNIVQKF
ncbi:MAG: hypothetical protein M3015_00195 [Bacteroidota bacterium]|nr:hypothetical protein [Bacteroidota bacterium]